MHPFVSFLCSLPAQIPRQISFAFKSPNVLNAELIGWLQLKFHMEKGTKLGGNPISEEQAEQLAKHHILPKFNAGGVGKMPLSTGAQIAREVSSWWNMRSTYVKVAAALEQLG